MSITSDDELQQLLPPTPPDGFDTFLKSTHSQSENYLDETFSNVYLSTQLGYILKVFVDSFRYWFVM